MNMTYEEAAIKLMEYPILKGFGEPQLGFIEGNISDKKMYKTLAEAQRAALADNTCTGFTYLPRSKCYRLRGGYCVKIRGTCVESGDYSYLKEQFQPARFDEL